MARSDSELINEVRALTGYDDGAMFTDSDIQALVDLGKEELRAGLGLPDFTFYRRDDVNTLDADRALFWFVCIATKVRAGEIGSVELSVNNLEETTRQGQFEYWFSNFQNRMRAAESANVGAASTTISRSDRDYEYDQPEFGDTQ